MSQDNKEYTPVCVSDENGTRYVCSVCNKEHNDELDAALCCLDKCITSETSNSIQAKIDKAIQCELRYDTDSLTSAAWDFLENKAPSLILNKIKEEDDDEITQSTIDSYLADIIAEYEETHANLRVHD